jgi:NADH-quinone oxidoreductase subunit D
MDNRIFKQRNVGIAVVTQEDAWKWGFTGVMLRGSASPGICARRSPTSATTELEFDIPVGKNGDCYDR